MSDLGIKVRLTADSSNLVGQIRLTEAEARKLGIGLAETGAEARKASVDADALAQSTSRAKGGLGQMAAEANALRAAIDPMYAAQQRFDNQLTVAEQLLGKAAITQREYGAAVQLARDNLREHATAVAGSRAAVIDHSAAVAQLRGQLDPMFAAQQRFDAELVNAERLLGAAAITQREYGAAVQLARDNLREHATAVAGDGAALRGHNAVVDGSTVHLGRQRAGYQQLGAQVQDTFVQIGAGTSVIRTLSLQLPQAASAVALLGTAQEGTTSKFTTAAAFLSGPYGAALFGVVSIGAIYLESLIRTGDETDKTTNAYKIQHTSIGQLTAAIEKLNVAKRDEIRNSLDSTDAAIREAKEVRKLTADRLKQAIAIYEVIKAAKGTPTVVSEATGEVQSVASRLSLDLDKRIGVLQGALGRAEQGVSLASAPLLQRNAKEATDPRAAIEGRDREAREKAFDRYSAALTSSGTDAAKRGAAERTYQKTLEKINRTTEAQEKQLQDRLKTDRRTASTPRGELADFISPVAGASSSGYGYRSDPNGKGRKFHAGTDLAVPVGTPVRAAQDGTVSRAGAAGNYGNLVELGHGGGTSTRYAHLSRFAVADGATVNQGDVIGYSGGARGAPGAGNSRGAHLHYEVRVNGKPVNPSAGRFPIDPADVAKAGDKAREAAEREAARLVGVYGKAENTIQGLISGFSEAPSQVQKIVKALGTANDVIETLGKEKPVGFEGLVTSAEAAKVQIAGTLGAAISDAVAPFTQVPEDLRKAEVATKQLDGALKAIADNKIELTKLLGADGVAALEQQVVKAGETIRSSLGQPFRDALRDGRQALDIQRLRGAGKGVEADQQAILNDLMRQYNVEGEDALALALQARGITADQLKQRLGLIEQEEALGQATQRRQDIERAHLGEVDRLRGNIERTIEDLPQRGIKALGDAGRELKGQVQSYLARYLTETVFGGAVKQIERQLTGQDQVVAANKAYVGQTARTVSALERLETAASGAADAVAPDGTPMADGVTITGQRLPDDPFKLKSPRELFGEIAKGLLDDVLGDKLAGKIGDKVGAALQGAATGSTAAGILFGKKANGTGAAVGGGIGQIAGESLAGSLGALGKFAGPFGAIAGGILGSIIGNSVTKPKFGSATLTSATGDVEATGRGAAQIAAAKGAAGSVQEGLKKLADALDAQLGGFNVTIGTYKDKFRVNTTGSSTVGGKKGPVKGLKDFGDDEAGAIAYAITDAIADGAVKGVSAAVQKALASSKDLETAITEALKVKSLEELLGGLTGQLDKQFRTFERSAADRLRIAKDYGFDLVAVEKRNAEDRVKLVDEVLSSRVGALKDLLADLTGGNLAEGSAAEKRLALIGQITAEEAKASAGEEGAAKRLADLNRRLVETSREAFGTAGAEYGADRASATSSAERIIAAENERVRAAQEASTRTADALTTGNQLANEGNDLAAQQLIELRRIGATASFGGGAGGGGGFSRTGFSTSRSVAL